MPPPEVIVDLNPASYQSSLSAFSALLESTPRTRPFLFAGVRTPAGSIVNLQVRSANYYIVAFEGADGWYCFDDEPGALGKPAGTGSN